MNVGSVGGMGKVCYVFGLGLVRVWEGGAISRR